MIRRMPISFGVRSESKLLAMSLIFRSTGTEANFGKMKECG